MILYTRLPAQSGQSAGCQLSVENFCQSCPRRAFSVRARDDGRHTPQRLIMRTENSRPGRVISFAIFLSVGGLTPLRDFPYQPSTDSIRSLFVSHDERALRFPRSATSRVRGSRRRIVRTGPPTASPDRSDHRLPSLKRAVSILQLWCILYSCMSRSTCIEPTLDRGGATWPRKRRRQRRRPARRRRSRPQADTVSLLRHIKARARLCDCEPI